MATIREYGDGHFQVTVSCGYDINGKHIRKSMSFTPDPSLTPKQRKKAVEAFAADYERKVKNGLDMDGRKITLKEFAEKWFTEYAPQHLEAGTIEKYKAEIDGKVLPALGHYRLTELRPHALNAFFLGMSKDGAKKNGKPGGYSKGTIAKTRNVLSSILRTATEWEIIEKNPLDKVRLQAEDTAEKVKYFTQEQAIAFLDFIEQPYPIQTKGHKRKDGSGKEYAVADYKLTREMPEQLRVLFLLAIFTGMRKGELLALEWSDFDFDTDTVSITKAVAVVDHKQVIKAPKTKNSRRELTIPHSLAQRIKAMRTERIKYRLSLGEYWQGGNWLFIQDNGVQMNYSTPYAALQDAIARYNRGKPEAQQLPAIPFHGLRHTNATLLIGSKQDVRTVAGRLGHAQSSTTMNIYSHFLKDKDRIATEVLEGVLEKQA